MGLRRRLLSLMAAHIKISRSGLIDSQRWKNAGNSIVGKPKVGRPVLPVKKKTAPKPKTRKKPARKHR